MSRNTDAALESFLVEDVILTLGNLRGSLAWFDPTAPAADAGQQRVGIERIGRQIEMLEDRARAVCRELHDMARQDGEHEVAEPVPLTQNIFNDARDDNGADGPIQLPIFRSQRGASGFER